jgi:hypothetical protein
MRPLLRLLILAVALTGAVWAAQDPYGPGTVLFTFRDDRVTESSGLCFSSRSDDVLFTHNDSGDSARIFAVNRRGETLATLTVPEAKNLDWEDIARGPDDAGASCLYVGDIGDNEAKRPTITVYRVPEPEVDPALTGVTAQTAPAERFELKYADGSRDAEALMVHPRTRRLFVVSKALQWSHLYAAPVPLKAGEVNTLTKVATIRFAMLPGTANSLREQALRLLATGGDISPDGQRVVVRTYTDAYEWTIAGNDVAAAVRNPPLHVPLPAARQGEAIAYSRDGLSLITTSEGKNAPAHELRCR